MADNEEFMLKRISEFEQIVHRKLMTEMEELRKSHAESQREMAELERAQQLNPDAAYTSLIPGERLDQDLCLEFHDLHQAIFLLNEELAEPHVRS